MNSPDTMGSTSVEEHGATQSNTQAEQAIIDAYGPATPSARSQMLSRLMGQAFEVMPPSERLVMITHLLRPLGMLSRATVADGVFLKNRCDGNPADLTLAAEAVQHIQACDVVALTNRVQQISVEVVDEIAKIIKATPEMANSPVAVFLAKIPLRRTRVRQADEAFSGGC